jgi:hypothetical protein
LAEKVGTTFLFSDLTDLYLNYSLDNERAYNGTPVRQGNLISGMKRRLSDTSSVYAEQRYQNGASTGLTRTTGINLVPKERWNFSGSTEIGTLRDSLEWRHNRSQGGWSPPGLRPRYNPVLERDRVST